MEHHAVITVTTSGEANVNSTSDLRDGKSAVAVIVANHLTYHYSYRP